jgi:hypothetical protein
VSVTTDAHGIAYASDDDGPRYFCVACRDEPAAWRLWCCAGLGKFRAVTVRDIPTSQCGRRKDHPPHTYAERCQCSQTNPVVAEHRRRLEEFRVSKKAERTKR